MKTFKEKYDEETDWKNKVMIMDSFHTLMLMKHGKRWTIGATARSLEVSDALVSENIRIAEAIHNGAEFSNRTVAVRTIRRLK